MDSNLNAAKSKILTITNRPENIMVRGKGCYLYDEKGNRFLDFVGGWATNTLGHSPKSLQDTLKRQSETLLNASPAFYNEPMLRYAEKLTEVSGFDRVFFGSSGAEVNESAIKLARKYGEKYKNGAYEIISLQKSFHGRTLATMAMSGKVAFQKLFNPKVPGFHHIGINDIDALKKTITSQTCAIILELIQGEGGVNVVEESFLREMKKLAKENDILIIYDEVQTGIGRTGKMFAFEHFAEELRPDILTLGKGMGGGVPLAAILTTERLNIFDPGDNGGTYGGQPLAMAVGIRILEEIKNQKLLSNVQTMENMVKENLTLLAKDYPIENIRGKGLLFGFDWMRNDKYPFNAVELAKRCFANYLIINAIDDKTIRLMPPLIVSSDEADEMFSILKKSIETKSTDNS